MTNSQLEADAAAAAAGDRTAATRLLDALQAPIYRLAVRMLGHPHDAEDAVQEILLIVLTHLGSFRNESAITTWAWRIAANYLLRVRRGRLETVTFESIGELLDSEQREPSADMSAGEVRLFTREIRLRCTEAMLLALDRDLRIAFSLVEILGLSNDDAAAVLELPPATFRKRLSRARSRLLEFLRARCGIHDSQNPCRCRNRIDEGLARGVIVRDQLVYAIHPARAAEVEQVVGEVDSLFRAADVLRHPHYTPPDRVLERVRLLLASRTELFDA
jgi:RNA polymerase sigma factor (sigma-70 family)